LSKEDKIKELFAEKLGTHEVPVNPELWNAIASQIGTSVAATSTGLSVLTKAIIGISAASVIGVGTYFLTRDSNSKQKGNEEVRQLVTENAAQEDSSNNIVEIEAGPIYSPPTVIGEVVTIQFKTGCLQPMPAHNENDEDPAHLESLAKREKTSSGSLESETFTNEPTQHLIGEKPTPVSTVPAQPKVTEKKETKTILTNQENNTHSVPKQEEDKKASFELTKLPNVYALNANGYFSIGHKGEYSDFQFTIMDNSHKVIFRSDRPDFEWRGTDLYGNQIEPGKYVYIITAKDINGRAINKYSPLTVIISQ
jgi:hypothetical protein